MLHFVSKRQASECLNLSGSTLKRYRLQGDWIEGVHWVRLNSRCIRYNLELIQDWLHNRTNPSAHHSIQKVVGIDHISSGGRKNKPIG